MLTYKTRAMQKIPVKTLVLKTVAFVFKLTFSNSFAATLLSVNNTNVVFISVSCSRHSHHLFPEIQPNEENMLQKETDTIDAIFIVVLTPK